MTTRMIKKYGAATLLLATAPAFAGAAAATHETATAATTTHTKRLVLHVIAGKELDQTHFAGAERVRSRATGKVVGFDSFKGHVLPDRVVGDTALAFKGGILLMRTHTVGTAPVRYAGRVIGGTGVFDGATGTAHGRAVSQETTIFTIRYSS